MFFNQAIQADVVIEFGSERIRIPRFTLEQWGEWAADVDAQRIKTATEGMNAEQRFSHITYYNVLPSDLNEMRRLVRTPAGINRVVRSCLAAAVVTARDGKDLPQPEPVKPEVAQAIMLQAGLQNLQRLAAALADTEDTSKPPAAEAAKGDTFATENKQAGSDPLPKAPAGASSA